MAIWSLTKAEMTDRIKTLVRRLSGNPVITYLEEKSISDSINQAAIDVSLETGVGRWRVMKKHTTVTTTANTQYADLSGAVLGLAQDSVRIESEDVILKPATLEWITQVNGDGTSTGTPGWFALDVSPSDPGVTRIQFAPVPDGAYTVDLVVTVLPDEDDIDSYPGWFFPALLDRAMANALRNLGFFNQSLAFEDSYNHRKQKLRDMELPDGPITIARPNRSRVRGLQSRIP